MILLWRVNRASRAKWRASGDDSLRAAVRRRSNRAGGTVTGRRPNCELPSCAHEGAVPVAEKIEQRDVGVAMTLDLPPHAPLIAVLPE